jgi:hypothetical protein
MKPDDSMPEPGTATDQVIKRAKCVLEGAHPAPGRREDDE